MIAALEKDPVFMDYCSGEKQAIMVHYIFFCGAADEEGKPFTCVHLYHFLIDGALDVIAPVMDEYMSVSQFKDFAGTFGHNACEMAAYKNWLNPTEKEWTKSLLVGSYVDAYFEGNLDAGFGLARPDS